MEKHERSDPTFSVFLVLSAIFLVSLMYVTFPRHDAPTSQSAMDAPTKK